MSESVWTEQVDTALTSFIQSIVKLKNSSGVSTSVPVKIIKPEEDFDSETYPVIMVSNVYTSYDRQRMGLPKVVSRDIAHHSLTVEEHAVPFNLFYQINFWSLYQSQMGDMTRLWLSSCALDFNLPVRDMSNNLRSTYALLIGNIGKSEYVKQNKRLFHTFMTYRLWVELDEKITAELPMLTEEPDIVSGEI